MVLTLPTTINTNGSNSTLFFYTSPIVQAPEQFCPYPFIEKKYNLFIVICGNRFGPLDGDLMVVSCRLNKC